MSDTKTQLPKLKGSSNYAIWKGQLKRYLISEVIFDYCLGLEPMPEKYDVITPAKTTVKGSGDNAETIVTPAVYGNEKTTAWKTWTKEHGKCVYYLTQAMEESVLSQVEHIDDAAELWTELEALFAHKGYSYASENATKLVAMQCGGESIEKVEKYCQEFNKVVNRLAETKMKLPRSFLVMMFLNGLGTHFETWRTVKSDSFQSLEDKDLPELGNLMASVQELSRNSKAASAQAHAAQGSNRQKNGNKSTRGGNNNGNSRSRYKKTEEKEGPLCKVCSLAAHETCWYAHPEKAPDDWRPQKQLGKFKDADLSKGNMFLKAKQKEGANKKMNGIAAATLDGLPMMSVSYQNAWFADSCANIHVANSLKYFVETKPLRMRVSGVKDHIFSELVGTIRLPLAMPNGSTTYVCVSDVKYCPDAALNLLSMSCFEEKGIYLNQRDKTLNMYSNDQVIGAVTFNGYGNRLFTVDLNDDDLNTTGPTPYSDEYTDEFIACAAIAQRLAHQRLGHPGNGALHETLKVTTGIEIDDSPIEEELCVVCETSKCTRHVSRQPRLEPVHALSDIESDILSIKPLANGKGYIVTFRCMKSKHAWSTIVKTKGKAFDAFVSFVQKMKKWCPERPVRSITLDGDAYRSYGGNKLASFCAEEGILIFVTVRYTPEQNGGAERFGRTLMEKARCMMQDALLPRDQWDEAVNAAMYLYNLTASQAISNNTPRGALNHDIEPDADKPDLSHLRRYGCRVFVTLPKEVGVQADKFAPKGVIGKLVGYEGTHIYRIWLPNEGVTLSSHVKFDESVVDHPNSIIRLQPSLIQRFIDDDESEPDFDTDPPSYDSEDSEHDSDFSDRGAPLSHASNIDSNVSVNNDRDTIGTSGGDDDRIERRRTQPTNQHGRRGSSLFREQRDLSPGSNTGLQELGNGHTQGSEEDSEDDFQDLDNIPTGPPARPGNAYDSDDSDEEAPPPIAPRTASSHSSRSRTETPAPTRQLRSAGPVNDGQRANLAIAMHVTSIDVSTKPIDHHEHYNGDTAQAFLAAAESIDNEPKTLAEAKLRPERQNWIEAAQTEVTQIRESGTYEVVTRPKHKSTIKGRWVFKVKRDQHGRILKYKARFVVKGFLQKEGIDYFETFASVAKSSTIKIVLMLAAYYDLEIDQMDVVTAFLNGELEEEIYVEPPEGFTEGKNKVWKLRKTLYGLKQSPRMWYRTLANHFKKGGLVVSEYDSALFLKWIDGKPVLVLTYVDDILIIGSRREVDIIKASLSAAYKMVDLGPAKFFLGIEITRDRSTRSITISQKGYIRKVLDNHDMRYCRKAETPLPVKAFTVAPEDYEAPRELETEYRTIVGELGYMHHTRVDIAQANNSLSRHQINPTIEHYAGAKHTLRYLSGSADKGLTFRFGTSLNLKGWADTSWADEPDTRRSTQAYLFTAGKEDTPFSWSSTLQKTVSLSSTEAEYCCLSDACKEALWTQSILLELGYDGDDIVPLRMYEDNAGAIAIAENPGFHRRTKHIGARYHFVRQHVDHNDISLDWVPTNEMKADGLTKPLTKVKFKEFLKLINMSE